jgi:ribosomal protein S18 acetylase RimI-like enzyme
MQLIQVTPSDIPAILEMIKDFYAIDGYPFDTERSGANLEAFMENESLGRIWLVRSGENVAGYVVLTFCFSFEFGGKTAFIDELYIVKEYRGQGLGRKVIERVLEQAKALGVQAVHLEVETHNHPGIRLYGSLGFKEHKRKLMTKLLY